MNHHQKLNGKRLAIILSCLAMTVITAPAFAETSVNPVLGAATASADPVKIVGRVVDENGEPLPGVSIVIQGTTRGVTTDLDGTFAIDVATGSKLEVSFIGMETRIIPVQDGRPMEITMRTQANEMDEVTVVAFAKQKKESVLASVSTVNPSELKVPSSNLTTALAGRIAGLISYQRSGEPGADNADFFVRGVTTFGYKQDPLILIDGIELSFARCERRHPRHHERRTRRSGQVLCPH